MYTTIQSKMFSNVVFKKCYNGYHIELEKSTNVFEAGKAYSASELLGGGNFLTDVLHFEGRDLCGWNEDNATIKAFIFDSKYSKNNYNNTFRFLDNVSRVYPELKKYRVFDNDKVITEVFGTDQKLAEVMLKHYCTVNRVENTGFTLDEISVDFKENFKSDYLSKNVFYIPDHNKSSTPFEELVFFKWLCDNKVNNHHNIKTIKEYLSFLGFDNTKERLLSEDMKILRYTLQSHFYINK